jgi:hypothetical protein
MAGFVKCRYCGVTIERSDVDEGAWLDVSRPASGIGRALCDPLSTSNQLHEPDPTDVGLPDFADVEEIVEWLDS